MRTFLRDKGTFGGDFANLLSKYLADKVKGDSAGEARYGSLDPSGANARGLASAPPSLIGQGERTQTAWITRFLLDPQPVRRMTVLRMPKFNMSQDEAQALAAYFASVSRQQNSGVRIEYPIEVIPQQAPFDSTYWKKKNQEYIQRLKDTPAPGGKKSLYELRLEQLRPFWKGDLQPRLDAAKALADADKVFKEALQKRIDAAKKKAEAKKTTFGPAEEEAVKNAFDMYEKPGLQSSIDAAKENVLAWEEEIARLAKAVHKIPAAQQEKEWEEQNAYVVDSFKVVNKVCAACHQLGKIPQKLGIEGPPLTEVHNRLRADWTEEWIAGPKHFNYQSIMVANFGNKPSEQGLFPGTPMDQVTAATDLLMVYPRMEDLPLNRYWLLWQPELKKIADDEEELAKQKKK